jgi:hypothetical protein
MAKTKLKVLRDPTTPPPWAAPAGAGPLFTGTGDTDYLCGSCEFVIASGIGPSQRVARMETDCPCCGALNEVAINSD